MLQSLQALELRVVTMSAWAWTWLSLALVLRFAVDADHPGPYFMVVFPSVIESGSNAKLCASLLNPTDKLRLTVSLLDDKNASTQLLTQSSRVTFHNCFTFQAPQVSVDTIQRIRVDVQGRSSSAMSDEKNVMFRPYLPLTFIQTDKPIYNPGQTVAFRLVTMDSKFVPLNQMYDMVTVEDNNGVRINQWTNVSSTRWILQLSHNLSPMAQIGVYVLKAFIGDRVIQQTFQVKKYVLPKFDITLTTPDTYSIGALVLQADVCGKYTYGMPVPGQVLVSVCRDPFPYTSTPVARLCTNKAAKTNDTGCASITFDMSMFFNTKFEANLQDQVGINASLSEEGTGVTMIKSTTVSITFQVGQVTFVAIPTVYAVGSSVNGKMLAAYYNGSVIARRTVYLLDGSSWPNKILLNLTTDQNGLATFSLSTTSFPQADLTLVASAVPVSSGGYKMPYFTSDTKVVQLLRPATPDAPTVNQLSIATLPEPLKCGSTPTVTVKYSFVGDMGDNSADIVYMVLSRGVIVQFGYETVQPRLFRKVTSMTGSMSFQLSVGVDMAPLIQILAYCALPNENIVVDSASFKTELCFKNQVSLQFSPTSAIPGEANVMTLAAQAGSLCALCAVDQSVLILDSGSRLDNQTVFNLLPVTSLSGYPSGVEDNQGCVNVRSRRDVSADQAYNTFMGFGMKMVTNLPFQVPQCLIYRNINYYRYIMFRQGPVMMMAAVDKAIPAAAPPSSGDAVDTTIRSYFPETWIWQLAEVGASGQLQIPLTVPDTITTWETETFCLSSTGLGLAPPVQLTVFQPFFLSLTLPYSIIRGEAFELKATVFNYMSYCIMVKVTPTPSSNFSLTAVAANPTCLCANARNTFRWLLTASVLETVNITVSAQADSSTQCGTQAVTVPARGRVDIVTEQLLVLAEGVQRTSTQSFLLCPKGATVSQDVTLTLPSVMISGSASCTVSVLGDVMGRALNNLNGLLQLPTGCGEQVISTLSPNIYILQYLNTTKQLTTTISTSAIGFIQIGYQEELNYRHDDGSFSTFGYDESNTWLTAFVMRSFGRAQQFVYIDPTVLQSAKNWLMGTQGSDGCFSQQGTTYHNEMRGGVGDNVTMTAYIAASLLELGVPSTDPVVIKALGCLKAAMGTMRNTYATALLAYTFNLAADTNTGAQLLKTLDRLSISDGTTLLHWSQTGSDDTLAVEISSYVLLAVLSVQSITSVNLGYANRIVNWIVAQQNPYGGFSSTQDTVVALQALSLYATQVFVASGSSAVTVQSAVNGGDNFNFAVNPNNRLLYQSKSLNNFPGKYSVVVNGAACVSVQAACFYNIPTPVQVAASLTTDLNLSGDCTQLPTILMLNITVRYSGSKPVTNMVIVDVKLLSGFTADTSLLGSAPDAFVPPVQRVEQDEDSVLVYLKQVTRSVPVTLSLRLTRNIVVTGLKPAVVHVYDYYQTSDGSESAYKSPCP